MDILINNAAMRDYSALAEASTPAWEAMLAVNVVGAAHYCRAALPALRQSGQASIVFVSSCYAVTGRKGMGLYDATKAAQLALTRTLAFEEAQHRVRVNAVCPGATLTPFHIKRAATANPSGVDLKNARFEQNLQKRWASPREIAYPILWLASPEASFVTGSSIMADGGTIA